MGLFELGADPPEQPAAVAVDDAALAIDALGALVEGLDDRLGEADAHAPRGPGSRSAWPSCR